MNDLSQILLYGFLALCLLPLFLTLFIMGWGLWFGQRQLAHLLDANPDRVKARYAHLSAQYPNASREAVLRRIIHEQALRSGIVGAITGLGGFVTLPVALPIDLLLSSRIQSALLQGIAAEYQSRSISGNSWLASVLLASGERASSSVASLFLRLLLRVGGKSLSKFVPILGAVTAFVVNYWITRTAGYVALQWYARQRSAGSHYEAV